MIDIVEEIINEAGTIPGGGHLDALVSSACVVSFETAAEATLFVRLAHERGRRTSYTSKCEVCIW